MWRNELLSMKLTPSWRTTWWNLMMASFLDVPVTTKPIRNAVAAGVAYVFVISASSRWSEIKTGVGGGWTSACMTVRSTEHSSLCDPRRGLRSPVRNRKPALTDIPWHGNLYNTLGPVNVGHVRIRFFSQGNQRKWGNMITSTSDLKAPHHWFNSLIPISLQPKW